MTTDEQYAPSEANVRAAYVLAGIPDNASSDSIERAERRAGPEFDRFLARVRRDAAREALDGLADESIHVNWEMDGPSFALRVRRFKNRKYPEETP